MQDAAARALADRLESQQFALGREVERLRDVAARLRRDRATLSWRGLARDAFEREMVALGGRVDAALTALDEAVANTARARNSVLHHVQ